MDEKKQFPAHDSISQREKDMDDFWDIDRLLPERQKQPKYAPVSPRKTPEAVEIDVPPVEKNEASSPEIRTVTVPPTGSVPLSFAHGEKTVIREGGEARPVAEAAAKPTPPDEESPLLSYVPEGFLVHRVDVCEWKSNYHYFDQFVKDAALYAEIRGKEAARETFFSYFPQYAQLNRRQRAWYLWWREQARAEVYLPTDYAYILLYLFELINLPAEGEVAELHRDLMAKVWVAYRKTYPQLDHYACEWLCDYCLIHQLSAPVLCLMPALGHILTTASLKEFYLSAMIAVGDAQVNLTSAKILLSHCCQYDYKKSKFYNDEHKALFDSMIPRALAAVYPLLFASGSGTAPQSPDHAPMPDTQITRDAYVGALCAYSNKRRIRVSYMSFSRSHDLRFMVGDIVRHIENRIRASVLVRSRLTAHFLTVPLRKALDAWLDAHLPSPEAAAKKAEMKKPRPEYEALYDLPHTEVSIASADEIEQSSWETTKILVEAFAEDEEAPALEQVTPRASVPLPAFEEPECTVSPTTEAEIAREHIISRDTEAEIASVHIISPTSEAETASDSPLLAALGERADFIRAILRGDRAAQKAYCAAHKKLPDAVVDEINDVTVEQEIFDVIIEEDGLGGYQIIEDYRETVEEILDI